LKFEQVGEEVRLCFIEGKGPTEVGRMFSKGKSTVCIQRDHAFRKYNAWMKARGSVSKRRLEELMEVESPELKEVLLAAQRAKARADRAKALLDAKRAKGQAVEEALEYEAKLDRLNTDHTHLQHVIGLCKDLLYNYKFTVDAVGELYKVAKMYGQPIEVITAVQNFGDLKTIKAKVKHEKKLKAEKKAEIEQLELREAKLRAKCKELEEAATRTIESMTSSLNGAVNKMGEAYTSSIKQVGETYTSSVKEIKSASEELSTKLAVVNTFLEKSEPFRVIVEFLGKPTVVDKMKAKEAMVGILNAFALWVKAEKNRGEAMYSYEYPLQKLSELVSTIK